MGLKWTKHIFIKTAACMEETAQESNIPYTVETRLAGLAGSQKLK